MLAFFQRYQKVVFIFVAVVVIASFSFFGTFETFAGGAEKREERVIGEIIDGSPLKLSEVEVLARFLSMDRADQTPNLCNDGVIWNDFLQTGIADLLVSAYFDPLKEELQTRLDRAKRHRPYAHPQAPYLNQALVWARFFPPLLQEYQTLRQEEEASLQTFSRLSRLYQQQRAFPPELVRRCLAAQQEQMEKLLPDPYLASTDLSLFGFHSSADWFGKRFVDLAAQFVLNAAVVAEGKGFHVSSEEAKGDLMRNFEASARSGRASFANHLRSIGFEERSAVEAWRKVLLFRRYFQSLSQAALIDRLPYADFASYALETAVVDHYGWPAAFAFRSAEERAEFDVYLETISPEAALEAPPQQLRSLEEIERRIPELVETVYRAQIAEVSRQEIALRASLQEVWDWQLAEDNWPALKKQFAFLDEGHSREGRFAALEKLQPAQRAKVDRWSRWRLLDLHPEWMADAIAALPRLEKTFSLGGERAPFPHIQKGAEFAAAVKRAMDEGERDIHYSDDGTTTYLIENLERIADRRLLTFEEAKRAGVLREKTPSHPSSNRLLAWTERAYEALRRGSEESAGCEQFRMIRTEKEIQRSGKENGMREQIFDMSPEEWSSMHVSEEGEIAFFFLREKKSADDPILEQLSFGKQLIASDAQRYLAERLIETIKQKNVMVIPVEGAL